MNARLLQSRLAAAALTRRELIRFIRQPSRVAASIGTPVLLWLFIASGMSRSFMMPGDAGEHVSYGSYLLPGVVTMTILFSTIFAAISLIQDRQEGFLQSVLVSPIPAWAIVASKVLGGAAVATLQAIILLLAAPFIGLEPSFLGLLGAVIASALTSIAVVGLGLAAAWWIDSTAGFHGVMNMLLMPMWLLSGALFPVQGSTPWLRAIVTANPLHWCHSAIAGSLGVPIAIAPISAWLGTIGFALAMFALASVVIGLRRS
ncbi:MAG: ABC transporter permease [Phycisphaerae bacterium]|nr:ABC transporter permease [Phycisphaerae bacterium]